MVGWKDGKPKGVSVEKNWNLSIYYVLLATSILKRLQFQRCEHTGK